MKDFPRRMSALALEQNIESEKGIDKVVRGIMVHPFRHAQAEELRLVDAPAVRSQYALDPRPPSVRIHIPRYTHKRQKGMGRERVRVMT